MPGAMSLSAGQYYAHPRNAFWKIMGELVGAGPDAPYAERAAILQARRIALWDVLHSCIRAGSLDADIRDEAPNDFAAFFATHPRIKRIGCNGAKAAASFSEACGGDRPSWRGSGDPAVNQSSARQSQLRTEMRRVAGRARTLGGAALC